MSVRARRVRRAPRRGLAGGTGVRTRRGALAVMAGVFIVMLSFFGAVAIDLTRLFTTRAELQTAADAGALAGAIQMLRDSSVAADSASAYAARNGLRLTGDAPDVVTVTTGVWNSGSGAFVAGGEPADAMRVDVTRHENFLLAQVVGGTGVSLSASATSWSSAPVNGSRGCMKPIMLPYDYLRRLANAPSTTLTAEDLRRLRELSVAERTDTFSFGWSGDWNDRSYFLSLLPPQDQATGTPLEDPQGGFYQYLTQCLTTRVGAGDWLALGARGTHRQDLLNGLQDFCDTPAQDGGIGGTFVGGSCFIGGSVVPMPLKVEFWDDTPDWSYSTHGGARVKTLGMFNVTFVDPTQIPNPQWAPEITYDVPLAKIIGYVSVERDYGNVGGEPSTLRRPVIVQ